MRFIKKTIKNARRFYNDVSFMIKEDIENDTKVPVLKRIPWYIKGFNSDRYYMYEFDKNNPKDYLPDFYKYRTSLINGPYSVLLNDKKLFTELKTGVIPFAETHGWIIKGKPLVDGSSVSTEAFKALVMKHSQVIIKRQSDGGGKGVYLIGYEDGQFYINRQVDSIEKFLGELDKDHDYIISEYILQSKYAMDIFPHSANTIRIQTMIDPDTKKAFIPLAIHKFGTLKSLPTDNQSKGGIIAGINLETGIMERASVYTNSERLEYFDTHPDTGAPIKGVKIPNWSQVTSKVCELAEEIDYLHYIGWDLIITDDGIKIVEGNNHTGIGLQMYQPLFANDRAKRFYDYHFERLK